MTKERDLLPWILGGLSAATLAVAVTAVALHKGVAPLPEPVPLAAAVATSQAAPLPTTAAAPPAAVVTGPTTGGAMAGAESASAPPHAEPVQATVPAPAAEPEVQAGQIWECVTNGVKTFSNNPCGEKSSLLEVRSINTMNPTPPIHYARAATQAQYSPQYAPQYAAQYAPSYADAGAPSESQEDYGDQDGADSGADSYTIVQGVAFLPRRRPPQHHHPHRPPYHHSPAQPPRKF